MKPARINKHPKSTTIQVTKLKLDTRSKILKAAIEMFADAGYENTSLRQITNQAGVNHGSIKYHFNNKEELWRESVAFLYAQMEGAFNLSDTRWDSMSTLDKIEFSMRTYIRYVAKHPEFFKITMMETLYNSSRLEWLAENITIPYTRESLALVKQAKSEGIYSPNIPDMNLFYLLIAASRYVFFLAPEIGRVFGKDMTSDLEIKRHEDAVVELFLGHLKPKIGGV